MGALFIVERSAGIPAVADHVFRLCAGARPIARIPGHIGAQAFGLGRIVVGDQIDGGLELLHTGQGARFEKAALLIEIVGKPGLARVVDGGKRFLGLVVEKVDHRQLGCDGGTCHPLQALFDLMIQKLFRRRQKIDRDQAFGQAADHFVAVPADGGEIDEIIE